MTSSSPSMLENERNGWKWMYEEGDRSGEKGSGRREKCIGWEEWREKGWGE